MPVSSKPLAERRARILVVDDEASATRMLGKLLQKCGYDVAEENNSTRAHRLARKYRPDLIILDIFMPFRTGKELAVLFETDNELCKVPIIFITAHVMLVEHLAFFHRVFVKPFSVEDLLAHIESVVAGCGSKKSS